MGREKVEEEERGEKEKEKVEKGTIRNALSVIE
jgi:hypothetical protein